MLSHSHLWRFVLPCLLLNSAQHSMREMAGYFCRKILGRLKEAKERTIAFEMRRGRFLGVFAAKADKNRFQTLFGRKLIEFEMSRFLGVFAAKPDKNRFQTLFGRKLIEFWPNNLLRRLQLNEISSLGVFEWPRRKIHPWSAEMTGDFCGKIISRLALAQERTIAHEINHLLGVFALQLDKNRFRTLFGRKIIEVFVSPLKYVGDGYVGRDNRRPYSSSSITLVSGSQPAYTFSILLHWPRSYGVDLPKFVMHAVCPKIPGIVKQPAKFVIPTHLVVELNDFWPDLESYGMPSKYELFWSYQWLQHGRSSGLSVTDFFEGAVNFLKRLPSFGLEPNLLTTADEILSQLHGKIQNVCGLSASTVVRGYIEIDGKRCYSLRVVEQIYLATSNTYQLTDQWRSLRGGVTQYETIVLPKDVLCRYKSPDGTTEILFVPGQANHEVHVLQQLVMEKMRDTISMMKNSISYVILENEQEKMGVLVHSILEQFNKSSITFQDFVTKVVPKCQSFLVVVTDMDNWDQNSYSMFKKSITKAIKQAIKQQKAIKPSMTPSITCVPISSTSNVKTRVRVSECSWVDGKCLYAVLDDFEGKSSSAPGSGDLRMCVHDTH